MGDINDNFRPRAADSIKFSDDVQIGTRRLTQVLEDVTHDNLGYGVAFKGPGEYLKVANLVGLTFWVMVDVRVAGSAIVATS